MDDTRRRHPLRLMFGEKSVTFERATDGKIEYPSKVRIRLVATRPVSLWAPHWEGCRIQPPFASGCELPVSGGKAWDQVTQEQVNLLAGQDVRLWVGLDPLVPNGHRSGRFVVPIDLSEGEWKELFFDAPDR